MTSRHVVRRLITCGLAVCWLCSSAKGIGYDDFPPGMREILAQRIDQLNRQGGGCIAGRVILGDGGHVRNGGDVMVNTNAWGDLPVWVYEGGWFIMDHRPTIGGFDVSVFVRAFGYDPVDTSVYLLSGQVTYLEVQLTKTPPEYLASAAGTVRDENDQPFNGAHVTLTFPFSTHGYRADTGYTYPRKYVRTGLDGRFRFYGLSMTDHRLTASASEYAYHTDTFMSLAGEEVTRDRKLYPDRRIVIDYVYQPDGSRSFDNDHILAREVDWLNGQGGIDFSQGRIEGYEPNDLRDLELEQDQDVLKFDNVYVNGQNGFYDAGPVPFESITEAGESGYSTREARCSVGHVYVVRTYGEGHYAKFIVKTDECSFRTVVPGDSPPMHLAGYGLTIDLVACDGYGRIYVRKDSGQAPGLQARGLPYYHAIAGLDGQVFEADILFAYDRADVRNIGLSEEGLAVYQSPGDGMTWYRLDTTVNLANHTLLVRGVHAFGLFAIAGHGESTLEADFDGNGIVDFGDLRVFSEQWLKTEADHPLR